MYILEVTSFCKYFWAPKPAKGGQGTGEGKGRGKGKGGRGWSSWRSEKHTSDQDVAVIIE